MSLIPDSTLSSHYAASQSGELVAIYSQQSNIKVWNSFSGRKSLEISIKPNVGPYSVVSWSISELYVQFSKKHIWTSVVEVENEGSKRPIIAYGTTGGSVGIMCGLIELEISSNSSAHSAGIRDIIWSLDCSKLYSSSDDKTIVEWNINKKGLNPGRVFKSGKKAVQKLACSSNGKFLVAASTHIRIWDIENETVLRKVSSHTSEVTSLATLDTLQNGSFSHVVSVGEDERMVSLSEVNVDCESDTVQCNVKHSSTLRCPYHPVSIQKSRTNDLYVLATNGIVYIYLPPFESEDYKPIAPVSSLQIVSENELKHKTIPILHFHCLREQNNLLLLYGNISKPVFEKVKIDLSQKRMVLERSYQGKSSLNDKHNIDVRPSSNSTVPMQTVPAHLSKKVKRKRNVDSETPEEDETTLGELITRLDGGIENSLANDKPLETNSFVQISSGSHVQMLCQSLQSDDSSLFNQVISSTSVKAIDRTVQSIPINYVIPLIDKLMSIMHTTPFRAPALHAWITPCLTVHSAYLLTVPDISDRLGLLYEILHVRASSYENLCDLQGELDLLVGAQTNDTSQTSSVKPKFVFVDDEEFSSDVDFTDLQELETRSEDESLNNGLSNNVEF